jgi:hypothetical protein
MAFFSPTIATKRASRSASTADGDFESIRLFPPGGLYHLVENLSAGAVSAPVPSPRRGEGYSGLQR